MADYYNQSTHGKVENENAAVSRKSLWRPIAIIVFVILMLFIAHRFGLGEKLNGLKGFIQDLGYWGPFAFFLIYVVATVVAIPGTALTVIAGAIFGSLWGSVIASVSSTVGAAVCFLIARYFARDAVSAWVHEKPMFQHLDRLTKEHGWAVVAITRLVPLFPYNLLNYGFGLTNVSFWPYFFWTWLCMLPATIAYVIGGDALLKGISQGKIPWTLLGILILAVIFIAVLAYYIKKKFWNPLEKSKPAS